MRLAKLTSRSAENKNTPIDVLYPKHADAIRKSHLALKTIPTLGMLINTREEQIRDKEILEQAEEIIGEMIKEAVDTNPEV